MPAPTNWATNDQFTAADADVLAAVANDTVYCATIGTETYTISSGSVTQISGTTLDGVSPPVGARVLIKDAPASSGAGSAGSSQPGNGIYTISGNTTNLTLARAADMSSTASGNGTVTSPAGASVVVLAGTSWGGSEWNVATPLPGAAFTYGTTAVQWGLQTVSVPAPNVAGTHLVSNGTDWVSIPSTATTSVVTVTGTAQTQVLSLAIPANTMWAGQMFRVSVRGRASGANLTSTVEIHLGTSNTTADPILTVNQAATPVMNSSAGTAVEGLALIRSTGSGGTAIGELFTPGSFSDRSPVSITSATTAVNTTVKNYLTYSTSISSGTNIVEIAAIGPY